jgi:hypothetical protein
MESGDVGQHHGVAVADDAAGRLVEGVDRRRLLARAVLHVVHRHAVDVHRLGQRRPDLDLGDGHSLARGGGLFERPAQVGPALDHTDDQVSRAGVRHGTIGVTSTTPFSTPRR